MAESSGAPRGTQGHTGASSENPPGRSVGVPSKRRQQPSGAQKRRRAKLKAAGVVLPRVVPMAELSSLTGTARESARLYREWQQGKISHAAYLLAVRGLGTHKDILTAVETHERTRQELEALRGELARIEGHVGMPLLPAPFDLAGSPAPVADAPAADGLDADAALDAALDTAIEGPHS